MKPEKQHMKSVLFEPVAPYFANTYNTLLSVVQGIAMAALVAMINKIYFASESSATVLETLSSSEPWKLAIVFLLICLIWHRYVTHDQYYAWRLGVWDSIIPIGFAVAQIMLVLSIPKDIAYFGLFITVIAILGFFAYMNTIYRHDSPQTKKIYDEHFNPLREGLSDFMYQEVKNFEKRAQMQILVVAFVFLILTLWAFAAEGSEILITSIVLVLSYMVVLGMLVFDFRRHLQKRNKFDDIEW